MVLLGPRNRLGSLQKEEAAHKSTRVELSEARERAEASLKEVRIPAFLP